MIALANADFELPDVSGAPNQFIQQPANAGWTFADNSGISLNRSLYGHSTSETPDGSQFAFIQTIGTVSQSFEVATPGPYEVSLFVAQRGFGQVQVPLEVRVDGTLIGTPTPPSDAGWHLYRLGPVTLAAGTHTLAFRGDGDGQDRTIFLDRPRIRPYVAPAAVRPAIGLNPSSVGPSSRDRHYADAVRSGSGFIGEVDAAGWPTSAAFNFVMCEAQAGGSSGTWQARVRADRVGALTFGLSEGAAGSTIGALVRQGDWWVAPVNIAGDNAFVTLQFAGCYRTAGTGSPGAYEVRVMRPITPGSPTSHDPDEFAARDYLAMLTGDGGPGRFAFNRNLDTMLVNNYGREPGVQLAEVTPGNPDGDRGYAYYKTHPYQFSQRTLPGTPNQSNFPTVFGISIEDHNRFCNLAGQDSWFVGPDVWTDDCWRQFFRITFFGSAANGDPFTSPQDPFPADGHPPLAGVLYFTDSNEAFNYDFSATIRLSKATNEELASGNTDLRWDDHSLGAGGAADPMFCRIARRTIEIRHIAVEVGGVENYGRKFRPVLDGQNGNIEKTTSALAYVRRYAKQNGYEVGDLIWGAGGSWYSDAVFRTGEDDSASIEQMFAAGWTDNSAYEAALAAALANLGEGQIVGTGYEGHADCASVVGCKDPRMSGVFRDLVDSTIAAGRRALCIFTTWVRPWLILDSSSDRQHPYYLECLARVAAHDAGPTGPVAMLADAPTPTPTPTPVSTAATPRQYLARLGIR